jgi:competence protein ComEA
MSRRNAEAGATATASRARRRLSATLGATGGSGGDGTAGSPPGTGPGLLDQATGSPGHQAFTYDGGTPAQGAGPPRGGSRGGANAPSRFRWRTGLRVAVLLGLVSVLLGGWFWWDVAASRPTVVPLGDVNSSETGGPDAAGGADALPDPSPGADTGAPTAGGKIVVHVAGAVNKAGVVQLPQGSRIHEAIAAAGGSTAAADLNRLNLAAVLEDGQKIEVPQLGDPTAGVDAPAGGMGGTGANGTGTSGSGTGTGPAGAKIDLNTASAEELGTLPRVGPVLAQRIVDWRKQHGRFKTVEELDAVDGVGPKMLETLLPLVKV